MAMSGGVDSSVAACLLHEQGWEVIGVTMKLYAGDETCNTKGENPGCCGTSGIRDARAVCELLGAHFYAVDYTARFRSAVIDYFSEEYRHGRTPNPCIACNQELKFGDLLDMAHKLDATHVATGHYAQIEYNALSDNYELCKGKDPLKDQSYFLYRLTREQLAQTLFPVGGMTKEAVRAKAKELHLPVYAKPGSQDICFVPDGDYFGFLSRRSPALARPGKIIDRRGKQVGKHRGVAAYTIGQRRGLGISDPDPYYVLRVDPRLNVVTVGRDKDLFSNGLVAGQCNWSAVKNAGGGMKVQVKIRYRQKQVAATIVPADDGRILVKFAEPQRAVTPGQAVVFYHDTTVLGGGVIDAALI